MSDLMMASSEADAHAGESVVAHHAEMSATLAAHVDRVSVGARNGASDEAGRARDVLLAWCRTDLVPHALAEESALYPAGLERVESRLLVTAMLAEHRVILSLVDALADTGDLVSAAAVATALRVIFESHLSKENELLLPVLIAATDVSVAELLDGMHQSLGVAEPAQEEDAAVGHDHAACGCGEVDSAGFPELDARAVPHAIRHATVFGALDAVRPGHGLVLVAPHDPLPLLAQIQQRHPNIFDVDYLERGPEAWRLAIVRRSA